MSLMQVENCIGPVLFPKHNNYIMNDEASNGGVYIRLTDCDTNALLLDYVQSVAMQAGNRGAPTSTSLNGIAEAYGTAANAYSPASASAYLSNHHPTYMNNGHHAAASATAMYSHHPSSVAAAAYPPPSGPLMAPSYYPFFLTDAFAANNAAAAAAAHNNLFAAANSTPSPATIYPNTFGSVTNNAVAQQTRGSAGGGGNSYYGTSFQGNGAAGHPSQLLQQTTLYAAPNKTVEHWRFGSFVPPQGKKKPLNGTSKTNLYIAGLSEEANDSAVYKLVEGVIVPKSCKALMSEGKCTGTGFIDCSTEEDAQRAKRHIEELFHKHFPSQTSTPSGSSEGNDTTNGTSTTINAKEVDNNDNSDQHSNKSPLTPVELTAIVKDGRKLEVKYAYENEKDLFNIYVRNLPKDGFTDKDLRNLFEKYGTVVSVKLLEGQRSNELTGAGFVRFSNVDETRQAIEEINESRKIMDGCEQPLRCKLADKTDRRSSRNGSTPGLISAAGGLLTSSGSGVHTSQVDMLIQPSNSIVSSRGGGMGTGGSGGGGGGHYTNGNGRPNKSSPVSGTSNAAVALLTSGNINGGLPSHMTASQPSPQHLQLAAAAMPHNQYYSVGQNPMFINSQNSALSRISTQDMLMANVAMQMQNLQLQDPNAVAAAAAVMHHNSAHPAILSTQGALNHQQQMYAAAAQQFYPPSAQGTADEMANYFPGFATGFLPATSFHHQAAQQQQQHQQAVRPGNNSSVISTNLPQQQQAVPSCSTSTSPPSNVIAATK